MLKIFSVSFLFFASLPLFAVQEAPKIVVIGAGLSGLTSAYYLQQEGIGVEVYEARNRVGGRIFTINVDGHLAELGGLNILDGGAAKNILTLMDALNLETEEKISRSHFYYFDNGKITDIRKLVKERAFDPLELQFKLEKISHSAKNMEEVLKALFDEKDILYKVSNVMLSAYVGAPTKKLSPVYIETLYAILLDGLSNFHQWLMVKGGNSLIAEELAKKLHGHIHLNHVLKAVAKSPKGSYILTFNDGEKIEADLLILSLPCSVYPSISIEPEVISLERQAAIKTILYGTSAKILLPIAPSQINRGAFTNGRMISFINRDDSVLNLYYVEEYGRFSAKTIGKVFQKDLPAVEKFYGIESFSPPVTAIDQSFVSYTGPVGHSWLNDPFAKGSYSCIGVGQEKMLTSTMDVEGETVITLFAPIDRTLFFSGEHTSILFDNGGTMEAAVESGKRTAIIVKKMLQP